MADLAFSKPSPRIENGVLLWYYGDTFDYEITISLVDQDGEAIDIEATDSVNINFYNAKNELVKTFAFGSGSTEAVDDNIVCLAFDETVSALFEKGSYHYDIILVSEETTTITSNAPVIVE